MKRKIFTSVILCAIMSMGMAHAQLLLEENFDYDAGRALILNAVASSDNFDGVTNWSTQSNSLSGTNCFSITNAPLTYPGYVSSGIGNALKFNGDNGQGPFRLFPKNIRNDSTVYISFMVNFPNALVTGGDYFFGIKMGPGATDTNWGGRIFASVNPTFVGEEVTIGINKMSGGTTTWVNSNTGPFYAANTTLLMVMKYKVGILNGTSAATEAGKFDDEMSLFINPPLTGLEPATPILKHVDPAQNDIYRYTSTGTVFGGARAIYLRPSAVGNAPAYTIDGIRVGLTWADVIPAPSGLKSTTANDFSYRINNKQITVTASAFNYNQYELMSLSGKKVKSGSLVDSNRIDASSLQSGVYLLSLKGAKQAAAKIIIP